MPMDLDLIYGGSGTRFLLYPQAPVMPGYTDPEVVWVSPPAGSIAPGPADDRMYVVDPIGKRRLYEFPHLPPWRGPCHPPAPPAPDGHFDHLPPGCRPFLAAHMYGTVRRVLDVWEGYFGRSLEWQFRQHLPRLELIPLADWDNAHSGYGFIETGTRAAPGEPPLHFCLSFDVLAHEIGHSIIFAEIGVPVARYRTGEFLAFHEAAADLAALIAVLHFDSVIDRLLERTRGNLYVPTMLSRIGELSEHEQIREVDHDVVMADLAAVGFDRERGTWFDAAGLDRQAHELSQPLTGAVFDILVDVFERQVVELGLFSPEIDHMIRSVGQADVNLAHLEEVVAVAFRQDPPAFRRALLDARDHVGLCLAGTWQLLEAEDLDFDDVAAAFILADREVSGGRYRDLVTAGFAKRGILPSRRFGDLGVGIAAAMSRPNPLARRRARPPVRGIV
jgi:hypothetical protein